MASAERVASEPAIGDARRWAITATVMLVSVLQILGRRRSARWPRPPRSEGGRGEERRPLDGKALPE